MAAVSFEEFLGQSGPGLARYAHVLTGDRHAAEDLLQETLVKAVGSWARIRSDGNPVAYVRTIMVRTHVSWWRRHRPTQVLTDEARVDDGGMRSVEDSDELRRALALLPVLQRTVLVLTFFDDATDSDIADLLRRRPSTVRSLRHRGLANLRTHLTTPEPILLARAEEAM